MFFNNITLSYMGQSKTVPVNLMLITVIEQSIDFSKYEDCPNWPSATLALDYSKILRHVGVDIDEIELARYFYVNHDEITKTLSNLAVICTTLAPPKSGNTNLDDLKIASTEKSEPTEKKD